MTRLLPCLASATILLAAALCSPGYAQADLVVQKTDISISKSTLYNTTYVSVTVHNNASVAAGSFALRIGVSLAGSSATTDFAIAGLAAGGSTSKMAAFAGTAWMCGWGNADIFETLTEASEANNCANANHYWIGILPGTIHMESIGVVNPGLNTETVTLSVSAPPNWIATVSPTAMTLGPGELQDATVRIGAPSSFEDYAIVEVYCNFEDGTPGVMDWTFHMESAIPVEGSTWGSIKALFAD